jgi:uncharacterized RDD family membrane protein YckC
MPDHTTVAILPPTPDWADPWGHPEYYAGITLRRILAYVIDGAIVLVLAGLVWIATGILGVLTFGVLFPLHALAVALVPFCYHSLLIGGPLSATVGMRAIGIRVMSIDPSAVGDGRPTLIQAMIQTVTFYGSLALTGSLVLVVALFNARRRTLHDLLAGTVVVNDIGRWRQAG